MAWGVIYTLCSIYPLCCNFHYMILLDGKLVSQKIKQSLALSVQKLLEQNGFVPGLAILLVGDDKASEVYVNAKIKACREVGFHSVLKKTSALASKEDLQQSIQSWNRDPNIHGILIQLPLPQALDTKEILSWLDPKKDPDGLTMENKALLWSGCPRVVPCTPKGIVRLLDHYKISLRGKRAVVVGRSQIVGLPLFQQFLARGATVTVCHSETQGLSQICRTADLVAVAVGSSGLLGKGDFKPGAVVIDVGIHRDGKKLVGDVQKEGLVDVLSALSPVPGGVGPMTIAMLLENTFELAQKSL